ncbi:unnamed protein product [Protopolystoma xenopodis]|uniref:Bestrophin homolog n=1 Tax=Protopolystoma xenopodis TaxID=117903 RepID=A0A448WPH4_9PLAT|nr:unnamed protein product [Protopolystoma xenopodis]
MLLQSQYAFFIYVAPQVAMCVMNPFGDDDEDFCTSRMLDYNLDISMRSAGAFPSMYPSRLRPILLQRRRIRNSEEESDGSQDPTLLERYRADGQKRRQRKVRAEKARVSEDSTMRDDFGGDYVLKSRSSEEGGKRKSFRRRSGS